MVYQNGKVHESEFLFFYWLSLGLVVWTRLSDPFLSQIQEKFVRLILQDIFLGVYTLFILSNFNFLHNSEWTTFPIHSCLVLYSLSAN